MVYIALLVKLLILRQISVLALLACCLPYVLWLVVLAACMGTLSLSPKAATAVAMWLPIPMGALSYMCATNRPTLPTPPLTSCP